MFQEKKKIYKIILITALSIGVTLTKAYAESPALTDEMIEQEISAALNPEANLKKNKKQSGKKRIKVYYGL